MRLLIDANVPRMASISAYKKIGERATRWGTVQGLLDVLEFGPPPYCRAPAFVRENIPFIPALAIHATTGDVSFFTYEVLEKEYWNVRPAIDWANRDIRDLFNATSLDVDFNTDGVLFAPNDPGCFDRYLNSIPNRIADSKLTELLAMMGPNSSRDCLHVWFADRHALDGFVTFDKTFIGKFNSYRKQFGYKVRALSPREACRILRVDPIGPEWFAERADPHILFKPHQPTPVGEYIFTSEDAVRLFSKKPYSRAPTPNPPSV